MSDKAGSAGAKTFIVTGANSGIGSGHRRSRLARRGGKAFIASRNEEKTQPVLDEIGENAALFCISTWANPRLGAASVPPSFLAPRRAAALPDQQTPAWPGQRGVTASGFEADVRQPTTLAPFLFTKPPRRQAQGQRPRPAS